jgi:hypothetical protein
MLIPRLAMFGLVLLSGCAAPVAQMVYKPAAGSNVYIPLVDPDLVWEEVVDVIDDYFRIEQEVRSRTIGNTVTEGRIDTFPEVGATLLEPWRRDVATAYDRLEATLQTIRRRALVRVIPAQGGFMVDVAVFKELEDLPRPQQATTGAATFRNEMSLSRFNEPIGPQTITLGWIPLGRDGALEQKILCKLQSRISKKIGCGPALAWPPSGVDGPGCPAAEALPAPAVEPPRELLPAP